MADNKETDFTRPLDIEALPFEFQDALSGAKVLGDPAGINVFNINAPGINTFEINTAAMNVPAMNTTNFS